MKYSNDSFQMKVPVTVRSSADPMVAVATMTGGFYDIEAYKEDRRNAGYDVAVLGALYSIAVFCVGLVLVVAWFMLPRVPNQEVAPAPNRHVVDLAGAKTSGKVGGAVEWWMGAGWVVLGGGGLAVGIPLVQNDSEHIEFTWCVPS